MSLKRLLERRSVFVTLGIIIVSTVTAIMLLNGIYSYHTIKTRLVKEMQQQAEESVTSLRDNITDLIEAYAVNEYENLIATEMQHRKIFAIVVRDFNMGKIIGQKAYTSGKIRSSDRRIINYDPQNTEHNRLLKACYYSQGFSIENDAGQSLGSISIYNSDDQLDEELNNIIVSTVAGTLAISFFLILILFLTIQRFILKPLSDMAAVIGQHDEDGIPTGTIPHRGPKEIYALSLTMSTMIETIKKSRTLLRELNVRLHDKIEEGVRENTRLEKEKLEQEKILIEQSKMAAMGEMISAIAHQWRQPLSSLSLDIQDLRDAKEYNELDDAYLNAMIERSIQTIHYMSQTIDDFRNFFLPNKKKEPFSVYESIEATRQLLGKQFEARSIVIDSRGDDFWIDGFKNEFQQVLINLLNNAKDAITKKREENSSFNGVVTIRYGGNRIVISNNGGAIPDTIIHRIFEPYFSTKFSSQGTGIGLYMSKMVIEQNMHGEIKAHNDGDNAVFEITFPERMITSTHKDSHG